MLLVITGSGCATRTVAPAVPSAPQFPDFVFPGPVAELGTPATIDQHTLGWRALQAGDQRAAERHFNAALKLTRGFYPAEAGLGYAALARKDENAALLHFDRAIVLNPRYAPALAGRGDALLGAGERDQALASFEAAVAADPSLTTVRSRSEVVRFRGLQEDVALARKTAEAGRFGEARGIYLRALRASPESAFLYRELASVEQQDGDRESALGHARRAAQLDPGDARALVLVGELLQAGGSLEAALQAYNAALVLEPSSFLETRIAALRSTSALAAMPAEYQAIETAPAVTRAQLAALVGVRLEGLLSRRSGKAAVVMTDTRASWAAPWISAVVGAGIMEVYANHTFQPAAVVRRADLALAASRVMRLIAAERPAAAAAWQKAPTPRFPDVPPANLSYPAVSLVVSAGVMAPAADGTFQLTRPASGAEAMAAVATLTSFANPRVR